MSLRGPKFYEPELVIEEIHFVIAREPNPEWRFRLLESDKGKIKFRMIFCRSGMAHYLFNGNEQRTVCEGDMVFIKPDDFYTTHSDTEKPFSFISVGFRMNLLNAAANEIITLLPNVLPHCDWKIRSCFEEIDRTWKEHRCGYILKCRGLFYQIIYELCNSGLRSSCTAHEIKIRDIIEKMRGNYTRIYSAEELCELSGLSESQFRSLFKRVAGTTPLQFQNSVRIEKARELIISQDYNVTEAAHEVGFTDVYYFSRMFKKITGYNPSHFI